MRIKEIIRQHRRDFTAIYVCDACGTEVKDSGYDDAHFHQNVVPELVCENCGKREIDFNDKYRPLATKYPEGMQI